MAQELKLPGGRRSWRDEARARLVEALGQTGERLGEGLLGESEEDKYLEFLQRTYGSELPRDAEGNINVPESRPLGQAFSDLSDFGAADKVLGALSFGSSVAPRLALGAGTTEMGMLLGDAQGEYEKGNTTAAGIMAALAGLPPAIAAGLNNKTFMDLGRDATSGIGQFIKNQLPSGQRTSMVTPEGFDMPVYSSQSTGGRGGAGGRGGGGGGGRGNKRTELQGYEENFPKLLKPTKGSSMRDSVVDDYEINAGDLQNTLNKYNLTFDDMKRIDIDSPEIYNNSTAEGRDLLENLELLTYPRKKPIYSQEYNEGMGTLDFYDTENGPIGIMQMDIDDSIEEMVFFVPNSKGFNKITSPSAGRLYEPDLNPGGVAVDDVPVNAGSKKMQPVSFERLSPIISGHRFPGQISNKVSKNNVISATVKGAPNTNKDGVLVINDILEELQNSGVKGGDFDLISQDFGELVRMEGVLNGERVVFSSTPISSDEYIISFRRMGDKGTPIDNQIDNLGRKLYDLRNVLDQEGSVMSVGNLTSLQNKIETIETKLRSLKR